MFEFILNKMYRRYSEIHLSFFFPPKGKFEFKYSEKQYVDLFSYNAVVFKYLFAFYIVK